MSKITFRADDDLVDRVEGLDASKSEVMREALRTYLDGEARDAPESREDGSLDDLVASRVDELVERRLADRGRDVNVNVNVEPAESGRVERRPSDEREPTTDRRRPERAGGRSCARCGETLSDDHVYCPNCGEKASNRLFCECGDELRSDWSYCPGCGRRTASADVLE
jgi:RNA polymerase subunit RPABC4/transcription elongation factor Spt4